MKLPINQIICGNCLEVMKDWPDNCVDLVLTDPPYPDYHIDKYKYKKGMLDFLKQISCRQIIFWSAKVKFPLDYTAIHIWDKWIGCGSEYERIFERNGGIQYKMLRKFAVVGNPFRCQIAQDTHTGHPSQKPIKLVQYLVKIFSKPNDLIFDPFCGSGTTCVAAKELGRRYIGIDISEKYCDIARDRLKGVRPSLFEKPKKKTPEQTLGIKTKKRKRRIK